MENNEGWVYGLLHDVLPVVRGRNLEQLKPRTVKRVQVHLHLVVWLR